MLAIKRTGTFHSALYYFFALWAIALPITSVVVVPAITGSVPAYLLAFCSLPLALIFSPQKSGRFLRILGMVLVPFISLLILSQLNLHVYWTTKLDNLILVNVNDPTLVFRSSLFTQSLYLLPGLLTFAFVATFYQSSWDKFIFAGALLLALYGFYESGFYLLTGRSGDFLSNRIFDNGAGTRLGSYFQLMTFGSLTITRLKSLTGEPSMYAFTILPFWIYALHQRKTWLHLILLISLLHTTTTTALLGITVYLICRLFFLNLFKRFVSGYADKLMTAIFIFILLAVVVAFPIVNVIVQETLTKLSAGNVSGSERIGSLQAGLDFFADSPLSIQLFGVGFGFIRSTDFFTTLLVNTGVIGLVLFCSLFLYPIIKLDHSHFSIGLKSALIVILITMMVAVSEFAYLSTWLFLGISYYTVRKQHYATLH